MIKKILNNHALNILMTNININTDNIYQIFLY